MSKFAIWFVTFALLLQMNQIESGIGLNHMSHIAVKISDLGKGEFVFKSRFIE